MTSGSSNSRELWSLKVSQICRNYSSRRHFFGDEKTVKRKILYKRIYDLRKFESREKWTQYFVGFIDVHHYVVHLTFSIFAWARNVFQPLNRFNYIFQNNRSHILPVVNLRKIRFSRRANNKREKFLRDGSWKEKKHTYTRMKCLFVKQTLFENAHMCADKIWRFSRKFSTP